MDNLRRADPVDPGKFLRIGLGQSAKSGGNGAVIGGRASFDGVGSGPARGESGSQCRFVAFQQDHTVGTQPIAAKGVERGDGPIPELAGAALIGAA